MLIEEMGQNYLADPTPTRTRTRRAPCGRCWPLEPSGETRPAACQPSRAGNGPVRMSWARCSGPSLRSSSSTAPTAEASRRSSLRSWRRRSSSASSPIWVCKPVHHRGRRRVSRCSCKRPELIPRIDVRTAHCFVAGRPAAPGVSTGVSRRLWPLAWRHGVGRLNALSSRHWFGARWRSDRAGAARHGALPSLWRAWWCC